MNTIENTAPPTWLEDFMPFKTVVLGEQFQLCNTFCVIEL